MQRCLVPVAAAWLVFLAPSAATAGEAKGEAPPEALNRKITLQRSRVYLGELLDDISRQAKVQLTVSRSRGPADGHHLSVFVSEQPLREVLEALCALFSHRHDVWEWRDDRRGGYALYHQRSSEAASAAMRNSVLQKWSADVTEYYRISRLPRAERERVAPTRDDLFPGPTVKSGVPDLFARLTPAQVASLIRGAEVILDPRGLDEEARKALTFGVSAAGPEERVGEFRKFEPGFRVTWDPMAMGPILWLRNEGGSEQNVVGGWRWDAFWYREQGDGWRDAGHPLVQAFNDQRNKKAAVGAPVAARSMADWMRLAAAKHRVNLLFDHTYPRGHQGAGQSWLGNTPEQTFCAMALNGGLVWKPHKRFHLLRDRTAIIHPRRHLLSWSAIRDLRKLADANAGHLSLETLQELVKLDAEQLEGLAEEFPDAAAERLEWWKPIFEFEEHLDVEPRRRLATEAGVPLRETGLVARSALGQEPDLRGTRNLKLLQERFGSVLVSLRQETYRGTARSRNGERPAKDDDLRRLVWEAWVPEAPRHRREFQLYKRRPLLPDDSGSSP